MPSADFLTAEWRKLAMFNYEVPPALLHDLVPKGTELDLWNGVCYVSLVGFMFQNVRVKGIRIPFHVNFEEVNLRFYVRHRDAQAGWKRGVVFVKEIVPRGAISFVAKVFYGEPYVAMPMRHSWLQTENQLSVEYSWKGRRWHRMQVFAHPGAVPIAEGSEEEFITEHYWGYTRRSASRTSEYEVVHPRWEVYPVKDYHVDVNFGSLYGARFEALATEKPKSVFLAEGSAIAVRQGQRIRVQN